MITYYFVIIVLLVIVFYVRLLRMLRLLAMYFVVFVVTAKLAIYYLSTVSSSLLVSYEASLNLSIYLFILY